MVDDQSSELSKLIWIRHPFHGLTDHLSKNDPRRSGTFSSDPRVLQALGTPIQLPTLSPDATDLEILARHYPNASPARPPWDNIRADLLAAGVPVNTVENATSRDLVRMLDRVSGTPKSIVNETEESIEEPDDLHHVRIAAHKCVEATYEYLNYVIKLVEAGEPADYAKLKGRMIDGPLKTGEQYLEADLDDPEISLEFTLRSLTMYVNELMEKHEAFQGAFEPLREELANVYEGLQEISGVQCRSHCRAIDVFATHLLRYTFDGTEKYSVDSEIDDEIGPDDAIPFTASNWFSALSDVLSHFPQIDICDHVHEAIEQEISDAWNLRLASECKESNVPPPVVNDTAKGEMVKLFQRRGINPVAYLCEAAWNLREWLKEIEADSTLGNVISVLLPRIRRKIELSLIDSELSQFVPQLPKADELTAGNLIAFIEGLVLPGGSHLRVPPGKPLILWRSLKRARSERIAIQMCDEDGNRLFDSENDDDLQKIEQIDRRKLADLWKAIEEFDPLNPNETHKTDSSASQKTVDGDDNKKKISKSLPDNVDVLDLCRLLSKNRAAIASGSKTEIGVAREFSEETPPNDLKARNWLRQARRFPHLWKD